MTKKLKTGTVIKSTGSWYKVLTADLQEWQCRIRGKLRIVGIKSTNPIAVGDNVEFEIEDEDIFEGVIKHILPRKNYIIRKSINLSKRSHILAANIDHVYLLVTLVVPETSTGFIDRFLITAAAYHIPVTMLFNKVDLFNAHELTLLDEFKSVYEKIGYRCLNISATNPATAEFLKAEIKDKKVMFGGHSGVGKSTLVNALAPELDIRTTEISASNMAGQHTTTFAEMHPLEGGGFIIDTPGIKAFGLIDFNKADLSHYFPEMKAIMSECKFSNCMHINEPKCAVKAAVENGEIAESRYQNYKNMFEDDESENYRQNIYKQ
ncbi:ribosome small subunit-dependent GTPase A [Putridiphycobacter roseus]|uniref:Small ribosomal subunit biogenesis GTPase RsgA n=1 Tax=Putridiphycobacter roseus TaxID=2219161 RepID=A0A2W1MWM9_9FLAO|nr:ribosome small subunit-dependent GTPase A [Putridiphycobacter roseus]PZE15794.1 ribosome small subunit-dependent GTPase A [Putridiphycobacter roseus]